MPIVYACIAPHGGNLLRDVDAPGPVPHGRRAMARMREALARSGAESVAILTPHGAYQRGAITLGTMLSGYGETDGVQVSTQTDLDLAAAWAYRASELGVPVMPLAGQNEGDALPLDWGVTIPLALLTPKTLPTVVCCPARDLSRSQLIAWGEALVSASNEIGCRVALIVSADQGHGHAADGPYGFTPVSAKYDADMKAAVEANALPRLLEWPEDYAETAFADSYWQTLALVGVQKHLPMTAELLSYEVDHYFGLLCAEFLPA